MKEVIVNELKQILCPAAQDFPEYNGTDVDSCASGMHENELDSKNCKYFTGFRFVFGKNIFIVRCEYEDRERKILKDKIIDILADDDFLVTRADKIIELFKKEK